MSARTSLEERSLKIPIARSELEECLGEDGPALSLPPAAFTSPEFYAFELEAIWGREWFCVGRANDIPKRGDYFTLTVGAEPLIVVRDKSNEVVVMSGVCQHRAMLVVEGSGNTKRFRCPYHEWVYALDGSLLVAPDLKDDPSFDATCIRLPRIRSQEWEGFVFACFSQDAPDLTERLEGLSELLAPYGISELRAPEPLKMEAYDWNWKLYGDECYHCSHLHSRTWNEFYPTPTERVNTDSKFNDPERGIIAYEILGGLDASPTSTGKTMHPALPGLSEEERSRLTYVTVAPNLLIIAMPDKVKYFLWHPTGPTGSTFGASWMFPESTMADPAFEDRWLKERDDLAPVMKEDIWAWSSVQAGMFSRFAPRSQYARAETVLVSLNRWLVERYLAADTEPVEV